MTSSIFTTIITSLINIQIKQKHHNFKANILYYQSSLYHILACATVVSLLYRLEMRYQFFSWSISSHASRSHRHTSARLWSLIFKSLKSRCLLIRILLVISQKCSMGFKSGEYRSQSMTQILWFFKTFFHSISNLNWS
mgnify:CR=1 FL=1